MIKKLFLNFIKENSLFYLYLTICCLSYLMQVFGSSIIYKKFFNKDISKNFENVFKQVCFFWISLFIVFILKSKIESYIIPDIVGFIRKEVIRKYIRTNEYNFTDKDVEKDAIKLSDFAFFFEKVFIWITETLIPTIVLLFFMNIYFFIKIPSIGIISLIINIINYLVIKSFFNKLMKAISKRQESQDKMIVSISENLNNLIDIHLNDKIDDTLNNTNDILEELKFMVKGQINTIMEFVNALKIINYSGNLLNIFLLYKNSKNIKDFFEIFSIFMLYIPIFESMTQQIPIKLSNLNDLLLISDYFLKNKKIDPDVDNFNLQEKGVILEEIENIVFENVIFSYEEVKKDNIINNFSLNINKTDKIAIISQSGSGKTTLMKLLLGFYKPQYGLIKINDINIENINLKNLRKKLNYINQRTLLLNDTIINNMKYGNDKTEEEIISILEKYDLLKLFKNSLNYKVDIGGKNISFGMQKIVFLIRGILKNSDVYIFDEPLTSLDKDTREKVIRLIDDYTRQKTLIVITHDDEILRIMNRVITI